MPTYRITAPDGAKYDVTGEGTAEEALAHIQSQHAAPAAAPPPSIGTDVDSAVGAAVGEGYKANPAAVASAFPRYLKAAGNEVRRLDAALSGVEPGKPTGSPEAAALQAKVQQGQDELPDLGVAGAFGAATPEALLSAAPIAKAGNVVTSLLPKAMSKIAPAVGDIVANAGYAGGKSALEGNDASQVAKDTMWGAGGAAAGRTVSKITRAGVNRATAPISEAAQVLKKEGIPFTPAQAYPGSVTASVEDLSKNLPGYGAAVEGAQNRTGVAYANRKLADALEPIGATPRGEGLSAVNAAHTAVDDAFDAVVHRTFLRPLDGISAMRQAVGDVNRIPLLDAAQRGQVNGYVTGTILPELRQAASGGQNSLVSGRVAKNLDAELGALARKYEGSPDPTHHPMGQAFRAVQHRLRVALDAVDPADKASLFKANESFKRLLPIRDATEASLAGGGVPSPVQLRTAMRKLDMKPNALDDAAVTTAPEQPFSTGARTNRRIGLAIGGIKNLPAALVAWAGGGLAGHTLYSPGGVKMQLALMGAPAGVRRAIAKLPLAQQVKALSMGMSAGTQLGRVAGQVEEDQQ